MHDLFLKVTSPILIFKSLYILVQDKDTMLIIVFVKDEHICIRILNILPYSLSTCLEYVEGKWYMITLTE